MRPSPYSPYFPCSKADGVVAMLLILAFAAAAFAQQPGPVDARESGALPEWAVKRAARVGMPVDCGGASEWKTAVAGSEIRVRPHKEIIVQGRDRAGLPWRVQASYPGDGGCRFVAYDLDRNGYADLIFLTANGGSGPAGVAMTVVAFDRLGQPVPWQATGPFALEGDRILNLVDLDSNGKIELLFPFVEEHGLKGDTAVHISLYTVSDGYFRRVDGMFAGRRFPVETPTGVPLADEPDLTNALEATAPRDTIARVRPRQNTPCWLEGISLIDGGIVLAPNSAASRECEGYLRFQQNGKMPSPLILAADLPKQGRVIDIDHSPDEILRQVISLKMSVAFAGRSCETGCRSLIMWTRPQ